LAGAAIRIDLSAVHAIRAVATDTTRAAKAAVARITGSHGRAAGPAGAAIATAFSRQDSGSTHAPVAAIAAVAVQAVRSVNAGHALGSAAFTAPDGSAVFNLQIRSGNPGATLATSTPKAAHAAEAAFAPIPAVRAIRTVLPGNSVHAVSSAAAEAAHATHAAISTHTGRAAITSADRGTCGDLKQSLRTADSRLSGSTGSAVLAGFALEPMGAISSRNITTGAAVHSGATRAAGATRFSRHSSVTGHNRRRCDRVFGGRQRDARGIERGRKDHHRRGQTGCDRIR
jgi:hypothetical protein